MDRLDRYLTFVRLFLPRAQQGDIIRELSEDIHARIEDRQAELGRPLTTAEEKTLIDQLGHPALLAGKYGPRRQLIGPELFPFYWRVLTLALTANVLAHVIAVAVSLATGRLVQPLLRLLTAGFALFLTFGVVTIVFAAFDYFRPRAIFGCQWDPSRLDREIVVRARRGSHPITRLAVGVMFVIWWIAARQSPALVLGAAADVFRLGPVWDAVHPWILGCALVAIAYAVADLIRPQRTALNLTLRLISGLAGLAILLYLLSAGQFVVYGGAAAPSHHLDVVLRVINSTVSWGIVCAAVVDAAVLVVELRWWVRGQGRYRRPHPGFASSK